ncbi:MAG: sigma-70 family RNA polymerase sigma factor, partial [Patescibacteria group bacterium]|nr:sigma-70 family RNA polymerase sigma factor [Patescibacteria group bacterium]
MQSEASTLAKADRRDAEFISLLGKHELQLSACVHALVPSWQDAEDVIQETRLQLWREFDKFRPGSNFPAWACTVARYMVLAHFKKNQRKPLLLSSDLADSVTAEILAAAEPDQ